MFPKALDKGLDDTFLDDAPLVSRTGAPIFGARGLAYWLPWSACVSSGNTPRISALALFRTCPRYISKSSWEQTLSDPADPVHGCTPGGTARMLGPRAMEEACCLLLNLTTPGDGLALGNARYHYPIKPELTVVSRDGHAGHSAPYLLPALSPS